MLVTLLEWLFFVFNLKQKRMFALFIIKFLKILFLVMLLSKQQFRTLQNLNFLLNEYSETKNAKLCKNVSVIVYDAY